MSRGPAPKAPELRQRRNRKSAAATLSTPESPEIPELPRISDEGWHAQTLEWWRGVWSSAMSTQYLDSDVNELVRVAVLVEDFWRATSARARKEIMAEIRLQEARFGLSPVDRDRLQWVVRDSSAASEPKPPEKRPDRVADPRSVLKAVS